jgi:hypothetical protein
MLVVRDSKGAGDPSLITYGTDGVACVFPLGKAHPTMKVGRLRVFHYQRGGATRASAALGGEHSLVMVAVDAGGTVAMLEARNDDSDDEDDHAKPRAGPILRRRRAPVQESPIVKELLSESKNLKQEDIVKERAWSELREEEALRAIRRAHEAQIADIENTLLHVRTQVLKLVEDNQQLPLQERLHRYSLGNTNKSVTCDSSQSV